MPSLLQAISSRLDFTAALKEAAKPNDLLTPRIEDKVSGEVGKRFTEDLKRRVELGQYRPTPSYFVAVPKPGATTRPAALLTLDDRVVYEALVESLRPRIENALPPETVVFWPRGKRAATQWQQFEQSPLIHKITRYVVKADVSGFYESINHQRLAAILVRATGRRDEADALSEFLGELMSSGRGLPQGLEASDSLATLYLAEVDNEMIREGYRYNRHGDDIRIATASYEEARRAIFNLEAKLRAIGLLMNSSKTLSLFRRTYEAELATIEAAFDGVKQRLHVQKIGALRRNPDLLAEALAAAGLDELSWDLFYHVRVSLQDVIAQLEPLIKPSDREIAEGLFAETVRRQPGTPAGLDNATFHQQLKGCVVRLAAAKSAAGLWAIGKLLLDFPDKTELLSAYLLALATSEPKKVVAQVARVFAPGRFRTEWETAWAIHVLSKAATHLPPSLVRILAAMVQNPASQWLASIEAAKVLSIRNDLTSSDLGRLWNTCPPVFRADLILAAGNMAPHQDWAAAFLETSKEDPIHTVVRRHIGSRTTA